MTDPKSNGSSKTRARPKIAYTADDVPIGYSEQVGRPGEYPFTRGIYPRMYRQRLWTIRQYAGYATAEESNRRYKYLLQHGTSGLSVAFDLPTQIGLDSDHPLARGEVGRVGVAIDSLLDMEKLFDGIPLADVSTSMTINATAAILLALYLAVARKQGADWANLRGTIQNDILKEYIARGTYIYPPEASLRIVTDIFRFCLQEVPRWNTISVSGYHIREAGATAAQEIAFTLANGETYVQAAVDASMPVDSFAPRISFFFNAHNDLLQEVAKYRAARRIWARMMRERFAAGDPKSWAMRFHAQTAGSTLTAQQPDNNLVRVALQALAAVLGGAQSLHTNARDEALALPTEASARLALRTQQILAYESGVVNTADPLGGSWYLESTTAALEKEAEAYLNRIRSLGGMLRAISTGFIQREIQEAAYQAQMRVESEEDIIVGVNRFREEEATAIELLRIDRQVEEDQVARLGRLKQERDAVVVERTLQQLKEAAGADQSLMPFIVAAVEGYATVGEISDALREVFGEFQESVSI